ncbi:MAG: hypothetical protein KGN34_17250 [Sphingomonadales bacterium]|nr:hypothetical protein [Sphingomonadales bacterium]
MLRRCLVALLAFCLAIPALAASVPQAAPCEHAMMAMPGMPSHHAPVPAAAQHDCIGCATPASHLPTVMAATVAPSETPDARPAVLAMRATTGPDSPPPRA